MSATQSELVLEIRQGERWQEIGRVPPGEDGSMSNNTEHGRDVIRFRTLRSGALIERSIAGVDFERGPNRVISTVGMEHLAALLPGESYEIEIRTDQMPEPRTLRFRFEAAIPHTAAEAAPIHQHSSTPTARGELV